MTLPPPSITSTGTVNYRPKSPPWSTRRRQPRRLEGHPPRQPGDRHGHPQHRAARVNHPLDTASRVSSTITPPKTAPCHLAKKRFLGLSCHGLLRWRPAMQRQDHDRHGRPNRSQTAAPSARGQRPGPGGGFATSDVDQAGAELPQTGGLIADVAQGGKRIADHLQRGLSGARFSHRLAGHRRFSGLVAWRVVVEPLLRVGSQVLASRGAEMRDDCSNGVGARRLDNPIELSALHLL